MILPSSLRAVLTGLAILSTLASPVAMARPVDLAWRATGSATTSPVGSAAFRQALSVLASGEAAAAFRQAGALTDRAEQWAIQWAAIYFNDGAIDHASIAAFAHQAPNFATRELYAARFERSLLRAGPSDEDVVALLGPTTPSSTAARIRLAEAYLETGEKRRAIAIAADIWANNFLDLTTERRVRSGFSAVFTRDVHWQRAVHLLMHDRAAATERITSLLTPAQQTLVKARIAVSRKASNARALLDAVHPAYRQHPLYLFAHAQTARRAGRLEDAVEFLNSAVGPVPDAAEWWYERQGLTRELLARGYPLLAYAAAAGYTDGPEGRLVEARFHAGWIALCFLDDPVVARDHFASMASVATLPDSVAQANYWLGRTNLMLGDRSAALAAFGAAASYGTVYYGQLARDALGVPTVELVETPDWPSSLSSFEGNALVRAARLFIGNDQDALAMPLIRHLGNTLTDPAQLLLTARLAEARDEHNLAISVADLAVRRGIRLDDPNFPLARIPADLATRGVDMAAVFAVTRQESRFQIDAISSAGARGLMQLMPATARETAAKLGVGYSRSRLTTDAAYNALLGSAYLAAQLSRYDGSLVLAAAAYNAGPGNANKWILAYGDPRLEDIDPVVWVELIPVAETRKYVQRVLGNYMVYRARLGEEPLTLNDAMRGIPRVANGEL